MIIELHLLQNFVPSNLNRDDTGSPKDCEFGGHRRARISSQCFKRAIRRYVADGQMLGDEELGSRTKRLQDALVELTPDRPAEDVRRVAATLLAGKKLNIKEDGKTEYLLFLGNREIRGLAELIRSHWDQLAAPRAAPEQGEATKKKSAKDAKKAAAQAVPAEIQKAMEAVLDGGKAADVAMFGRMLADLPDANIDAACQVAHAISVNRAMIEHDYYTAVDDLKPEDTAGADMIGTVELTSNCFYRYLAIHWKQLLKNLQGDADLARRTITVFLEAAVHAVPTGKQNGTAAHNPPSLVMAVVRDAGCWNLANAFVSPVQPHREGLIDAAIGALDEYWGNLNRMFSGDNLRFAVCAERTDRLKHLSNGVKPSVREVFKEVERVVTEESERS